MHYPKHLRGQCKDQYPADRKDMAKRESSSRLSPYFLQSPIYFLPEYPLPDYWYRRETTFLPPYPPYPQYSLRPPPVFRFLKAFLPLQCGFLYHGETILSCHNASSLPPHTDSGNALPVPITTVLCQDGTPAEVSDTQTKRKTN